MGFEEIEREALAYSLYKYAENKGIRSFRIADLYSRDAKSGAFKEFGIKKNVLERTLRSLNSDSDRILIAELNMGLDNITLKEGLTPTNCLKLLVNR